MKFGFVMQHRPSLLEKDKRMRPNIEKVENLKGLIEDANKIRRIIK